MEAFAFDAQVRKDTGKKATKAIKKQGLIPCVLYGGDDVVHFATSAKSVKNLVYSPSFKIAELGIDGATHRCILKDIQYHPVTEEIIHMDFLRLIDGTPINVEVPVKFKGVSPGVKEGGKLQQNLRRVKIRATPDKIVDHVVLDISKLKLGDSIRVRDIEVMEGVEITNSPGIPVAAVEIPRALRSATAAAAEAPAA